MDTKDPKESMPASLFTIIATILGIGCRKERLSETDIGLKGQVSSTSAKAQLVRSPGPSLSRHVRPRPAQS